MSFALTLIIVCIGSLNIGAFCHAVQHADHRGCRFFRWWHPVNLMMPGYYIGWALRRQSHVCSPAWIQRMDVPFQAGILGCSVCRKPIRNFQGDSIELPERYDVLEHGGEAFRRRNPHHLDLMNRRMEAAMRGDKDLPDV